MVAALPAVKPATASTSDDDGPWLGVREGSAVMKPPSVDLLAYWLFRFVVQPRAMGVGGEEVFWSVRHVNRETGIK